MISDAPGALPAPPETADESSKAPIIDAESLAVRDAYFADLEGITERFSSREAPPLDRGPEDVGAARGLAVFALGLAVGAPWSDRCEEGTRRKRRAGIVR
jgi:hypothetical protein